MCTGLNLIDSQNNVLFARSMDFSFELDPIMAVVPRNYPLKFAYEKQLNKHLAFQGLSKDLGSYFFADGVNEHGLVAATLYFEGYAHYESSQKDTGINLAGFEVVPYMLAQFSTVAEIIDVLPQITLVDTFIQALQISPPLHFVFTDKTGRSIIVEPRDSGLEVFENETGVLTNAPDYNWHLTNLRNYIGLNPNQRVPRTIDGLELKAFGQGSGTFGLPGDFTPPSRFVKAYYLKTQIKEHEGEYGQVMAASHILNNVDIPKGAVVTQRHTMDYTQYLSFMSATSSKYYFRLYDQPAIVSFDMNDYDLESESILTFDLNKYKNFA